MYRLVALGFALIRSLNGRIMQLLWRYRDLLDRRWKGEALFEQHGRSRRFQGRKYLDSTAFTCDGLAYLVLTCRSSRSEEESPSAGQVSRSRQRFLPGRPLTYRLTLSYTAQLWTSSLGRG